MPGFDDIKQATLFEIRCRAFEKGEQKVQKRIEDIETSIMAAVDTHTTEGLKRIEQEKQRLRMAVMIPLPLSEEELEQQENEVFEQLLKESHG